jgi:hypothetical protein
VVKERKEKPQKRLEKCAFFRGKRKSGPKTRLLRTSGTLGRLLLEAAATLVNVLTIVMSAKAALNDYITGPPFATRYDLIFALSTTRGLYALRLYLFCRIL